MSGIMSPGAGAIIAGALTTPVGWAVIIVGALVAGAGFAYALVEGNACRERYDNRDWGLKEFPNVSHASDSRKFYNRSGHFVSHRMCAGWRI